MGTLDQADSVISYALNPLPAQLGRKYGKDFPRVQKTLREGAQDDVRGWAQALQAGQTITVSVNGDSFEVTPEECEVKQQAAAGFAVAEERGYLAAVDVNLTEDLVQEGLAREVVRRIQTLRRDAGLEIDDHIEAVYTASGKLAQAIDKFQETIKAETLARSLTEGTGGDDFAKAEFLPSDDPKADNSVRGDALTLAIRRVAR